MIRLVHLPANQAWTFICGDAPMRLHGEPLLFKHRGVAVQAATRRGLTVSESGEVTLVEDASTAP